MVKFKNRKKLNGKFGFEFFELFFGLKEFEQN